VSVSLTGVVAVDNALAETAFMPLSGIQPDEHIARLITVVVLLIQVVLVVVSARLASMINSSAVGIELALVAVLSIVLIVAVAVTGRGSLGNLVSRGVTQKASDYFTVGGGLTDAMIMGLATLVGFDSAANLAEEAKDPYRSVPRAIVGSVAAAGALGLVFVITVTIAIDSIPKVTDSDSPIAAIIRDQLGSVTERVFVAGITLAFFGAGTAVMTACSRLVFAMSRDSRFPAHRVMRRVNPRTHTPIPATLMTFVVGVVLMVALPGGALLKLIVASTILPAIIYSSTIVLYLVVRKQLGRKEGAFNPWTARTAGRYQRAGVGGVRPVCAHSAQGCTRPRPDCRRLGRCGWAVLPQPAHIPPRDARDRARQPSPRSTA
jgi:amino acid transporter